MAWSYWSFNHLPLVVEISHSFVNVDLHLSAVFLWLYVPLQEFDAVIETLSHDLEWSPVDFERFEHQQDLEELLMLLFRLHRDLNLRFCGVYRFWFPLQVCFPIIVAGKDDWNCVVHTWALISEAKECRLGQNMVEYRPHFIGVALLNSTNILTDLFYRDLTLIFILLASVDNSF